MRWSWLRAVLLGVAIGPAPAPAEPADADPPEPIEARRLAAEGRSGEFVHGPHFYVWDEDSREAKSWALDLLRADQPPLARAHWRSAAADRAAQPPLLTSELEDDLGGWVEAAPEGSSGPALGFLLCLLPSLDRTCLVSAWATSPREPIRRALAGALAAPFEAVGVRAAIAQLSTDPSPEVRQLAQSAAASRQPAGA
jgi:hypothetical protein